MSGMAAALPYISAGSTLLSAYSSNKAGKAQQKAYKYAATVATQQAQEERAAAQRTMLEARRQGMIAASRAQAVAAASGGGALDPTVVNIISGLEGAGEYVGLAAMYEGESRAQALLHEAAVNRATGKAAKKKGSITALGTILGGADTFASLFKGFGGTPDSTSGSIIRPRG